MRHLLADAVGGARIAAGAEGALVQALDRARVLGLLGQDGEGKIGHLCLRRLAFGRGEVHRLRGRKNALAARGRGASCIGARNGLKENRDGTTGRRRLAGARPRHRGRGRHVRPHQKRVPQLGDARRCAGRERRRRFSGRARPLSPLRRPLLPLGAPHLDLPRAEETRNRDFALDRLAADAQRKLGLCRIPRCDRGQRQRQGDDAGHLPAGRSALHRARDGAGAVGQATRDDREQRVVGNHSHVQFGLRRVHGREDRLLPGGATR